MIPLFHRFEWWYVLRNLRDQGWHLIGLFSSTTHTCTGVGGVFEAD